MPPNQLGIVKRMHIGVMYLLTPEWQTRLAVRAWLDVGRSHSEVGSLEARSFHTLPISLL